MTSLGQLDVFLPVCDHKFESVFFPTGSCALIPWFSLAMTFWLDPVSLVSTVLMAAHTDLEGAQAPSLPLVFCVAFCPSTSVVPRCSRF